MGDTLLHTPDDRELAVLADRQHGVVSTAQLMALGLARIAIARRTRAGRLHPVHRGVYAVGHLRLSARGRLWAALLASGGPSAAVVSHRSAAALWDLLPTPAGRPELTTLGHGASTPAIRVHRSRSLDPERDVVHDAEGLPRTSVTRTLIDLADVLPPHRLRRACHQAQFLRRLDAGELVAALDRLPGRRARGLRAALAELAIADPELTRSILERRLLTLVAEAGLPRPATNVIVEGDEVDLFWRAQRLIAEADGAAAHLTPRAFERDRRRDAALQVKGYRVVRFTWAQVTREPRAVGATLRALLGAG